MASQVKQIRRRKQTKKQQTNKTTINRNVKKTVDDLLQEKSTEKVIMDMMGHMILLECNDEIHFDFSMEELLNRCLAIYSCYKLQKDNDVKRFVKMCFDLKNTNRRFFSHLTLSNILSLTLVKYDKDVMVNNEKYRFQGI